MGRSVLRLGCASLLVIGCGARTLGGGGTDSTGGTSGDAAPTGGSDSSGSECTPGDKTGGECSSCTCGPDGRWNCGSAICLAPNKDVDILFVIDNSGSMGEEQGTLSANFGAFINTLEAPDVQANYRIGITTSDNGNPWCAGTTPEGGALRLTPCTQRLQDFSFAGTDPPTDQQSACSDFCSLTDIPITPTTTENDPTPKARPWMESIEGATNLPDGVSTLDAFQCFGPQGINGCGFESQLESMYKAVKRSQDSQDAGSGFMRDSARLAIVIVTDEADCSAQNQWSEIFLPRGNRVFWSDPNAAYPSSAVCWNAGVECSGGPGIYDECHAVDKDVNGNTGVGPDDAVLHSVSRYTDLIQDLEHLKQELNPESEIVVSVIAGVPGDYVIGQDIIYQDAIDPGFQGDFGIGPGCSSIGGAAVPPVRIRDFAVQFEVNGDRNLYSVCSDDYSPALNAIAQQIADQIKPACYPGCAADADPATQSLDPQCTLKQTTNGSAVDVPECTLLCGGSVCTPSQRPVADSFEIPAGANVCYRLLIDDGTPGTPSTLDAMDQDCIDEGWNLEFKVERRVGVPAPAGASLMAECTLSQMPAVDCPNL